MKKVKLILVLFLISNSINSQFYKRHEENKLKFYLSLDFRNACMSEKIRETFGLKLGVGNKSLRFGASYHIFHKQLLNIFTERNYFSKPIYQGRPITYSIVSLFTELTIHETERWELMFPIYIGTGNHIQYDGKEITNKTLVSSLVLSVKANYRVVKSAGLTVGVGYNFSFSENQQLQQDFSKYFYSLGVKLFFGEFFKLARDKEYREKYLFNTNFIDD